MGTEESSLILSNNWTDGPRSSEKVLNPRKSYFMNLAVKYVSKVDVMIDYDGIPVVQKVMIVGSLHNCSNIYRT